MMDDSNVESLLQGKLCSACGEPPRGASPETLVPLKRCSRCRQVWYHDLTCQTNHFPSHKKECCRRRRRRHLLHSLTEKPQPRAATLLRVEPRPNRGNCLVASVAIRKRERIVLSASNDGEKVWDPLVPPALLESQRWSRCAFCFQKLEALNFRFDEKNVKGKEHAYPLFFCSAVCRDKGRVSGFDREEASIIELCESRGHIRIFSTSVLLYRIIVASQIDSTKQVQGQVQRLQCKIPDDTSYASSGNNTGDPSYHHSQAVIATVVAMLQASGDVGFFLPSSTEMEDMVNRIKINGFSIADGESTAMGIGIFSLPSFMNHSCRPNTIQTFLYGQNHPPSLLLTAYDDINADDEIMISYLDNSMPRHLRRQRLQSDYFFSCGCDACADSDLDSQIVAVKCTHCLHSERPVELVETLAPAPWSFRCFSCHTLDFSSQMRSLRSFEEIRNEVDISTLDRHYKNLKQKCQLQSWYVQECGDRLVHAFLEKLGQAETIEKQEDYAKKSLSLLQELLSTGTPKWSSSAQEFRRSIQRFQEAKLRLFLEPDPLIAIQLLEQAQAMLSSYYHGNHELLQNLAASLREARI